MNRDFVANLTRLSTKFLLATKKPDMYMVLIGDKSARLSWFVSLQSYEILQKLHKKSMQPFHYAAAGKVGEYNKSTYRNHFHPLLHVAIQIDNTQGEICDVNKVLERKRNFYWRYAPQGLLCLIKTRKL